VLEQGSDHAANHAAALSQAFDLDCIKRKEGGLGPGEEGRANEQNAYE
jgi:hypothetical protein